jgi:hypothetical protein
VRRLDVTTLAGGLALLAIGTLFVLDADDVLHLGFGWLAPLLVGSAGLVLVASGAAAAPRGAAAARQAAARPPASHHRPATIDALLPEYRLAMGRLLVDLSALELPPGPTEVKVRVDMGEATVLVPAGASVLVKAHAAMGSIEALGEHHSGINVTARHDARRDGPRLLLDVSTAMGQLNVARAA